MPSYSEILTITGLRSKNSAHKLIARGVKEGIIEKDSRNRLIPTRLLTALPVAGTVEAGFPTPAEAELIDTMTLDEYLIENREATFLLKVSGDSMIEAGIMPGDMVLVERGRDPKNGDIVIAEVDHHWTMKFFQKKGGLVFLMPGNKKYPPITPIDELHVAAIVRAVVRKY